MGLPTTRTCRQHDRPADHTGRCPTCHDLADE